jgi:hypothetical protein
MENTCYGTFLTHYEFTGSLDTNERSARVVEASDPLKSRRAMSMKKLMSAAHAAGYAMAAEDLSEPRAEHVRAPSTALVVRPVQRGMIANAQRSVRRMWLQWFSDHWGHRAAA